MNAKQFMHGRYRITYAGPGETDVRELVSGEQFRLDEEGFSKGLVIHLKPLDRDLLRFGMAVYVVDRLVRRYRRIATKGSTRIIELEMEVSDPDFWMAQAELVSAILRAVSDDFWAIRFVKGSSAYVPAPLFPDRKDNPVICLFSGGLDSAAGLAQRLREVTRPFLTVTACHQPGQRRRVNDQVVAMARHYGRTLFPVVVRTTLVNPPLLKQQELSQRCRAFLFTALGGAVASVAGGSDIEMYESGVGAINLPAMSGMVSGGRSTKGCHPRFLRLMGELISRVAGRRITISLPFKQKTKAEVVRVFAEDSLGPIAVATVSCVHYPLHDAGAAKQCGVCMGCLGRRQALITAQVVEDSSHYKYDLFESGERANSVPERELDYLKATLLQVFELSELSDDGLKPELFRRYMFGTEVLAQHEPIAPWVSVMRRYRDEWRALIARSNARQIAWANWLPVPELAA